MRRPEYLRYKEQEMRRLRREIADRAANVGGVICWIESGNIVPPCVLRDAGLTVPAEHQAAYDTRIDEIRVAADRPMTEEEKADARAALGPGAVVVNVLTGRRTQL